MTLQAEEIHNIPGTFGDPFRTAMLLPGVGSIARAGYPFIRGEAPGQTGTFIDEVKVPLLSTSDSDRRWCTRSTSNRWPSTPATSPADMDVHGGADPGAHDDAAAEAPTMGCRRTCFKLAAFHTRRCACRTANLAVSEAVRYGTFAFLARAIDPRAVLEYWDYQVPRRFTARARRPALLIFGAQDTTGFVGGHR